VASVVPSRRTVVAEVGAFGPVDLQAHENTALSESAKASLALLKGAIGLSQVSASDSPY
jgi:hypothetical protein